MKTTTVTQRLTLSLKQELDQLVSSLDVPASRILETLLQSKSIEEIAAFINHKQPLKPVDQPAYEKLEESFQAVVSKDQEKALEDVFNRLTERSFRSLMTRLDFELGDYLDQRIASSINNALKGDK